MEHRKTRMAIVPSSRLDEQAQAHQPLTWYDDQRRNAFQTAPKTQACSIGHCVSCQNEKQPRRGKHDSGWVHCRPGRRLTNNPHCKVRLDFAFSYLRHCFAYGGEGGVVC